MKGSKEENNIIIMMSGIEDMAAQSLNQDREGRRNET